LVGEEQREWDERSVLRRSHRGERVCEEGTNWLNGFNLSREEVRLWSLEEMASQQRSQRRRLPLLLLLLLRRERDWVDSLKTLTLTPEVSRGAAEPEEGEESVNPERVRVVKCPGRNPKAALVLISWEEEMERVRRSSGEEPEEEVKEQGMPREGRVMLFSERMPIAIVV
jgi:hypothetical protein